MAVQRGIIARPQKVVIYGPEGIGKSYFASKFPNPIFIDTEGSTYHMDVAREDKPSSWTMLLQQVQYYKNHPAEYDTLVIDTADWAERLCIEHLISLAPNAKEHGLGGIEGFGYGKGYTYLAEEFGRLLNHLTDLISLGINVVLVCHAQMRKFEEPDEVGSYDRWELKLQKKTAPLVKEWADMLLFANYKTHVVNVDGKGVQKGTNKARGGKRVMYTTHHPCWDAKNRHDLQEELELHYSEIAHCIPARGTAPQQQIEDKPVQQQVAPPEPPKNKPEPQPPETKPDRAADRADWSDIAKKPEPNLPRALLDLAKTNNVTVEEIQRAVASRGYYPADTPIENYDPDFINGVLVGAWPQMFQVIQDIRDEIPF